ncbi:hypothetical protein BB559_001366 [Furculomyces boomerangus]|uniref:EXPERA domain-containing protein n=2 Tax=Harpellales TaxID=61421 RepID=A0A2T9Z262_9FUNG|nr:hypothetical protein BB559_001366 [Furculomyces boomerangus]PWA02139.1 hypothetical protein BB558_001734 [Smittium angustum]
MDSSGSNRSISDVPHPYFPKHIKLDLRESFHSTITVLAVLGSTVSLLVFVVLLLAKRSRTKIRGLDKFALCWFTVCSVIHIVLEGYFAYNHKTLASKHGILADLWREYSHSDSRYLTSDPFTVIMESITAIFDGALSIASIYAIFTNSPARHIFQLICSVMQLYGDVLYMLTNKFENYLYTNPDPYYFWVYFFAMNIPWIIIPIVLICQSCKQLYIGMNFNHTNKLKDS